MKTETDNSDKTQLNKEPNHPLQKTDVKRRFFAQYWGQIILGSNHFKHSKAVIFNYEESFNVQKGTHFRLWDYLLKI
jgi:hypothetical protein